MHNDSDVKGFQKFARKWAWKKMQKLEKKLLYYTKIYFGEPRVIIYARRGTVIVHKDGSESVIGGRE